jgi:hypothetical protein
MKKYLFAYIIGFSLLIGSVVNIVFELSDFELYVTPSSYELSVETITYDISELMDEDGFTSYYKHEIDESIEDYKVEIEIAGIGDLNFIIRENYRRKFINDEERSVPSFYIHGTKVNISSFIDSIVKQIENKKFYTHDYQYGNFEITVKMNSKTAEKYVD